MPMTVITVTNAPPSLKGDLTKWMQEISTGVYIGNFNAKIREQLWKRVKDSIGNGQATISFRYNNEIGYRFHTFQTIQQSIDYDGIQLVIFPNKEKKSEDKLKTGFSNAAKFRKAEIFKNISNNKINKKIIILDIETDGLDSNINNIIEIGAIKVSKDKIEKINLLINTYKKIPKKIEELTGIDNLLLEQKGINKKIALEQLLEFIEDLPIIGYYIDFDIQFINKELEEIGKGKLQNKTFDLLKFVKKEKMFLNNYKLSTVLREYNIEEKVIHRALSDAEVTLKLAYKVNGFLKIINKNG